MKLIMFHLLWEQEHVSFSDRSHYVIIRKVPVSVFCFWYSCAADKFKRTLMELLFVMLPTEVVPWLLQGMEINSLFIISDMEAIHEEKQGLMSSNVTVREFRISANIGSEVGVRSVH
jgi:hypothetical protein